MGDAFKSGFGSNTPVSVLGISTAVAISAGYDFYCALLRSGSVDCWGDNGFGELGKGAGTATKSDMPVVVQGVRAPTKLASGSNHNCTLFSGGLMTCWGYDHFGQLGVGYKNDKPNPSPLNVVGTPGVVWESSNTAKVTITDLGVAAGRAVGTTTITATTAGFINESAVLTVK